MNGPFKPVPPGMPPYIGDSNWGCDPFPDGNVVGPVLAPAIPWIDQYLVVANPKPVYRSGKDFLLEVDPVQRGCRYFHDIAIYGQEKFFERAEALEEFSGLESVVEQTSAMNGSHPSSQLKAVIEWVTARGNKRRLIADIGTGLDVTVGPTNVVRGFLLVPDPNAAPDISLWPEDTAQLADQVTATVVAARGTMNRGGQDRTYMGRYTQTVLVGGANPAFANIKIPPFARTVQVFGPSGETVTGTWAYDLVAGAPIPLGSFESPPNTDNYDVVQNAKYLSLSSGVGVNTAVTAVFTLSF